MRAVGVGISDRLHHRQMSVLIGRGKAAESGVQTRFGIQQQGRFIPDGNLRPGLQIFVIADRDHRVEAVVSPGQLQHHENISVFTRDPLDEGAIRFGVQRLHGATEKGGQRPAEGSTQEPRSQKFSAGFEFRG